MKNYFVILGLGLSSLLFSQNQTYIKGNAVFLPLGIANVAIETQVAPKLTLQGDLILSPWKSFLGHHLQYYGTSIEGRYYLKEAFSGFYVGLNLSAAAFNLQKRVYWYNQEFVDERGKSFILSNLYQKGYSVLLGLTLGYQFKISNQWSVDFYATAGTSQDFYKGYDKSTGLRYDYAEKYNKSGELTPYRGGIMISYKIK